ncbi:MAG: hypothetical protein K9M44_01605 [Candidatus Pacebacteria bacterium]|nr:hypothetical protein [Candidatus Paceibacterota bacterium]
MFKLVKGLLTLLLVILILKNFLPKEAGTLVSDIVVNTLGFLREYLYDAGVHG